MHSTRRLRNIALIGFMGAGKSTVGHALAASLNFQFVDTDDLIEKNYGKRIAEIFAAEGEAKFRQLEAAALDELDALSDLVIATGGGLGADPKAMARLKKHALTVCLWASPEIIWERVRHQTHRPLLQDCAPREKIRRLLAQREPVYRQADVLISTEMRSVKEVAHQVAHQFKLARQAAR